MPATPQPVRRPAAPPARVAQPAAQQAPEPQSASTEAEDPFAQQDDEAAAGIPDELDNDAFDLSDVEAVAFTGQALIPAGVYPYRVENAEYKLSSAGNRMFALQLKCKLPDEEDYTYTVFAHPTLSPKEIGRTKHTLNVMTDGTIDWANFRPKELAPTLIGIEGRVKLRPGKEQNGYPAQMQVGEFLPAAEAMGGFTN